MYEKIIYPRHYVERKNNFPFVYLHGLGGWGDNELVSKISPYWGSGMSKNITPMAKHLGFKIFTPSIGGWIGNWDRACNLWAMLVGGTVDYGKVHSERHGHARYGRTYEKPLIPEWGKLDDNGKREKINLIGHSLGGSTLRLFMELLESGSEEERNGTPENELSELFKGGKNNWIHTATVIAPCYGTSLGTAFVSNEKIRQIATKVVGSAGAFLCDTPFDYLIDFRLEHLWGGTHYSESKKLNLKWTKEKKEAVRNYMSQTIDNVTCELSYEYAPEVLKNCKTNDKTYYFSYTGCVSEPTGVMLDGAEVYRAIKGTNPIFALTANFEGKWSKPELGITPDKGWRTGDGMVNTNQCTLKDEKKVEYTGIENVKPGIWNVIPQEQKHHMSYMGSGEPAYAYQIFYYEIMRRACNLPSID